MTSPTQEPGRIPRAATYARANQRPDRYRRPLPRTGVGAGSEPSKRRHPWAANRRRFWFFTGVLAIALAAGAVTLSAVLAAPLPMAEAPDQPAPYASQRRAGGPEVVDGADPGGQGVADDPGDEVAPHEPGSDTSLLRDTVAADRLAADDPSSTADSTDGAGDQDEPYTAGSGGRGGADDDGRDGDPEPPADGSGPDGEVYYKNCGQARKAGAAPLRRGEPGYREALDPDGDGVACQRGSDK